MKPIDVSVVIGFRDWGLQRIRLAVESIKRSFGRFNGEVIISDYGSMDAHANELLAKELDCGYVYTTDAAVWSRSRALNAGFAISHGRLLVSTDADMVFSPTSFERILEIALAQPRAAYFLQCRDLPKGMDDDWVAAHPNEWEVMEKSSRIRPRWGMGGMMAISRQGFFEIRGFDERFHTYGGEDLDFAQRARRAGFKTVWVNDPDVRMYHMWHPSTRAIVDQTAEGRATVERNRDIVYNDSSFVRNYLRWDHRPTDAPPLVTVAICTHNRADLIRESIQSVLYQTIQDFEIVVIDDGGDDNTKEVLDAFGDDRIRYYWQENAGISAARNLAAEKSRGIYTAVLDDDDLMHPRRLEWQVGGLEPGTVGNVGSFINFDDTTGELHLIVSKKPTIGTAMPKGSAPGHSTWMLRTDVIRSLKYDESLTSGVDNNIMLRLLRSGLKLSHVGKPVTLRRMHSRQVTVLDSDRQLTSASSALKFIQWRLNPGDLKNIENAAKESGEYPRTPPREEMLKEAELFLPDHLANRDLILAQPVNTSVPDVWDGHLVQAEVSIGAEGVPPVALTIVRNATFNDLVSARQAGLDFSVEARTAHKETTPSSWNQIQLLLKSAGRMIADEGLKIDFVLVKRDNASDAGNFPWSVKICAAGEVERAVVEDSDWMIFGNEYWEIENAD
ncbi:glycosyltransferase [Corynebacterium sp. HMSC074A01]|uniref:glycosyltransferase n=1 Tax=Corynebacterium sp. HMSC074A01 TaxID=1715030 RepID=UPI001439B6C9|nr:glycosyltransferase [Corynebacterium sp. HMSC074A01]